MGGLKYDLTVRFQVYLSSPSYDDDCGAGHFEPYGNTRNVHGSVDKLSSYTHSLAGDLRIFGSTLVLRSLMPAGSNTRIAVIT